MTKQRTCVYLYFSFAVSPTIYHFQIQSNIHSKMLWKYSLAWYFRWKLFSVLVQTCDAQTQFLRLKSDSNLFRTNYSKTLALEEKNLGWKYFQYNFLVGISTALKFNHQYIFLKTWIIYGFHSTFFLIKVKGP